jgi:recombination protein RecR
MSDTQFRSIVRALQTMPGVGPRHAARIAMAMLDWSQDRLDQLSQAIGTLRTSIILCRECFNVSDDGVCSICRTSSRDARSIMVVEKITDLESVERAGLWRGLYHVLGGSLNPVDGVGPDQLRLAELAQRVDRFLPQVGSLELVLATNPTSPGEMTALYIREMFTTVPAVRITRLARGLSSGTHIEYADELTLKHALDARS